MLQVADFFCGCGGFSYGFQEAGYDVQFGLDNNMDCQLTYEHNVDAKFICYDIMNLVADKINGEVVLKDSFDGREIWKGRIDVVIGSPPCPEFSTAKLNPNPIKGMVLVNKFRDLVRMISPDWWVMENVPGITYFLDERWPVRRKMNCVHFGVPQNRVRSFSGDYLPPKPSHARVGGVARLGMPPTKKIVSVREAIGDLVLDFPNESIPNHVATISSQESIENDFTSKFTMRRRNCKVDPDKPSFTITRMNNLVPLVCRDRFENNKSWSPEYPGDRQARTITTFPHYVKIGNEEWRRMTVREMASLQSFPRDFEFFGGISAQYDMVGRAVPPLMAKRIALASLGDLHGDE